MDAAALWHSLGPIRAVLWITPVLLITTPSAHAAAIGAVPKLEGFRVGALAGMSRADLDDPDGPTESKTYFRLALVGTLPAGKDRRWLGEVFYHRFDLEPGTATLGVDVTRIGTALSYQARFATLPLKPWLGVGAALARDRFDERLTIDTLGFVNNRFPSRSDTALGMLLSATTVWKWSADTDVGLHLQYEQPLAGDVKVLTLGVLLMF